MSLETLLQSKQSYATVVFLNTFTTNPQLNNQLKAKLRHPGVTAIWTYAPGLVTPDGFSNQNMETLTGIKLKAVWKPLPSRPNDLNGDGICVSSREKNILLFANILDFCEEEDVKLLIAIVTTIQQQFVRKHCRTAFCGFHGPNLTQDCICGEIV